MFLVFLTWIFGCKIGEKLTKKPQIQSGISNAALHNFSKIIKNES